ncbi:MAG: hypothetical protein EBU26_12095 [Verrucomicrobia bacterium]|nr:hypothetical protein [Verrucomicrobiota bacterium]
MRCIDHFFIAVPLHSTPGWHDPIQIESYQSPLRMVVNLLASGLLTTSPLLMTRLAWKTESSIT